MRKACPGGNGGHHEPAVRASRLLKAPVLRRPGWVCPVLQGACVGRHGGRGEQAVSARGVPAPASLWPPRWEGAPVLQGALPGGDGESQQTSQVAVECRPRSRTGCRCRSYLGAAAAGVWAGCRSYLGHAAADVGQGVGLRPAGWEDVPVLQGTRPGGGGECPYSSHLVGLGGRCGLREGPGQSVGLRVL